LQLEILVLRPESAPARKTRYPKRFRGIRADVAATAQKGKRGFHLAAISLGTAGKLLESLNPNFAIPGTGITGL
jgi:hypothetical protein